jgi:DNA-binding response OmpR family regulator
MNVSEIGHWSLFAQAQQMTAPATKRNAPIVLIVEDDWFIRSSIAEHFCEHGWEVREVATGEAGVAYLRTDGHLDVLFTDIQLGGLLTGWDVGEAFRAVHAGLPVVYASGRPVDSTRVVRGGVFLAKPYKLGAVLTACKSFL